VPTFDPSDTPRDVLEKATRYASEGRGDLLLDDDPVTAGKLRLVGVYDDRQQGYFMLRTRIPGGRLTWRQAETIGLIADEFTARPAEHEEGPERFLEITTRQDIQFHWVRPADLPEIWRRYDEVGVLSLQACGDSMRNITACPIAGVDRDEVLDVTSLVETLNRFSIDHPEYGAGLPRKFKTAITGCTEDCILARINDIAFTPADRDGVVGFNVWAGGGLSDYPRLASPMNLFVTPDLVIETVCAAIDLFKDVGDYENKAVNRFRRVVDEMGIDRVREEIGRRVSFSLAPAGSDLTVAPRYDHVGVHAQKGDGKVYVGLAVPIGRMSGAEFAEIARLAHEFGDGEVRTTQRQNLVLTGVDESRVEDLLTRPLLQKFSPRPPPAQRSVVACTSAPFCKFGIVDAKSLGLTLADELDELTDGTESLRVHISGCKASCAQVQVADIGLRATLAKDEDAYHEAFDIALGGSIVEGRLAPWVALEVPTEQAFSGIKHLVTTYRRERQDDELFSEFLDRIGLDRAAGVFREPAVQEAAQ
jgi:ferredoxin-nitrite reductase